MPMPVRKFKASVHSNGLLRLEGDLCENEMGWKANDHILMVADGKDHLILIKTNKPIYVGKKYIEGETVKRLQLITRKNTSYTVYGIQFKCAIVKAFKSWNKCSSFILSHKIIEDNNEPESHIFGRHLILSISTSDDNFGIPIDYEERKKKVKEESLAKMISGHRMANPKHTYAIRSLRELNQEGSYPFSFVDKEE